MNHLSFIVILFLFVFMPLFAMALCLAGKRDTELPKQSRGLAATANVHRNEMGVNQAAGLSLSSWPERLPGDARLQLSIAVEKGGTSEGIPSTSAKTGYETVEDNRQVPSPTCFLGDGVNKWRDDFDSDAIRSSRPTTAAMQVAGKNFAVVRRSILRKILAGGTAVENGKPGHSIG